MNVASVDLELQRVVVGGAGVAANADRAVSRIRTQEIVGEHCRRARAAGVVVPRIQVEKFRAVRHGVEVVVHLEVASRAAHVGGVHRRAPPKLAPQADGPVVRARGLVASLERLDRARRNQQRRAGDERIRQCVVGNRWIRDERRIAEVAARSTAEPRVVEQPGARVHGHLALPGQVPRESDARFRLRRQRLAESLGHAGIRLQDHPVRLVAGVRHVRADVDLIQDLSAHGIERDARAVDEGGRV